MAIMQRSTLRKFAGLGAICFAALLNPQMTRPAPSVFAEGQERVTRNPPNNPPAPDKRGQTVTRLSDGRWLHLGGMHGTTPVSNISLRNPDTGQVSVVPTELAAARAGHTANVLPDGTVLIFGGIGVDGRVVHSAELFDPLTNTLRQVGEIRVTPRAGHSATVLTDGQLLVVGGVSGVGDVLSTAELFDPRTGHVEAIAGGLASPRRDHVAELAADGSVVIRDGVGIDGGFVNTSEAYDPLAMRFVASAPRGSGDHTVYIAGSIPAAGDRDVPLETIIAVRFSSAVDGRSVSDETVRLMASDGNVVVAPVAAEGGRLIFVTPKPALVAGADYTLVIEGVRAASGEDLQPASISWTMRQPLEEPTASPPELEDTIARDTQGRPRSPWLDLAPLTAEPGVTAVSGRVLRLNGQPLSDVLLEMEGQHVRTDRTGRFLLRLGDTATTEWV